MLQALYFCKPFRDKVLEYKARNKRNKETLLTCLADLFHSIATQKKKVGSIAPKKFINRLRKEKGLFFVLSSIKSIEYVIVYLNSTAYLLSSSFCKKLRTKKKK